MVRVYTFKFRTGNAEVSRNGKQGHTTPYGPYDRGSA